MSSSTSALPVPEAPHPSFPRFRIGRPGSLGGRGSGGGRIAAPKAPKVKPPRIGSRAQANQPNRQPAPIIHIHQGVPPVAQPKEASEARKPLTPRGERARNAREHLRDVLGDIPANRLQGAPAEARELTRQHAALHSRDFTKGYHEAGLEWARSRLDAARSELEPTPAERAAKEQRAGAFGKYNFREQMKDIGAEAYARDEAERRANDTEPPSAES